MLIDFTLKNFRSIRKSTTVSLVADADAQLRDTNVFDPKIPGFKGFLRSIAVYGPNASGKTNLLRGLQVMQALVVNSAIASQQGTSLPYHPFKFSADTRNSPSEFEVTFAERGVRFQYGFAVDAHRIHSEWLISYPHGRAQRLFDREYVPDKDSYKWSFSANFRGSKGVWRDATRQNALFLSTAVQLNNEQLLPVFTWFQKRLVVIASGVEMNPTLTLSLLNTSDGKEKILDLVRAADLGISDFTVKKEPLLPGTLMSPGLYLERPTEAEVPSLIRITSFHNAADTGEKIGLALEEESQGTQALFRTAGAWLNVLANGEVLLFDEIDTSLHPLMTRFLTSHFHSDVENRLNAQLLFTTHDTSLLDLNLFRRDQIWFLEKTNSGDSNVYPLTEFKPRKGEAIERGYLSGRYGALPIIGEISQ